MVCIVDYGVGNIGSIRNMIKKIGHRAIVSSDPEEIAAADRLILPGVGSFDYGMDALQRSGLAEILQRMGIRASEMGLKIKAAYDNGVTIPGEELVLDLGEYRSRLEQAYQWAFRVAVEAAYPAPKRYQKVFFYLWRSQNGHIQQKSLHSVLLQKP